MPKISIKHICGHSEERLVRGDSASRERTIDWLTKSPCRRCYWLEQQKRREDLAKETLQTSLRLGFPILIGGEADTREAIILRQKIYETACKTIRTEEHRAIRKIVSAERHASFWLEHKRDSPRAVLNAIIARHPDIGK